MDSVKSLENFNNLTKLPFTFSVLQQLVIFLQNGTFEEVVMVASPEVKNSIIEYEYFVIEEENSVHMLTFVWYSSEKCGVAQLVEVNIFDKSSSQWQHGSFNLDKFSNFHGCQLNFLFDGGMSEFWPLEVDNDNKAITKCHGYSCAIVRDFSSALNYTFPMNMIYESKTMWPEIPHDMLVFCDALMYRHIADPTLQNSVTRPFYHFEHFLATPPGEEYNEDEKLLLPFDEPTWLLIGITFAAAFATIFARYLLMLFILFSLVVRTAYQEKMFEFLQKEMRKPTVTSVDEMIDQNFTFYMLQTFKSTFPELDTSKR